MKQPYNYSKIKKGEPTINKRYKYRIDTPEGDYHYYAYNEDHAEAICRFMNGLHQAQETCLENLDEFHSRRKD